MKICVSLAFTYFVLYGLLLKHIKARPQTKIAVVRTFSLPDASKLPATFDAWNIFPPCSEAPTYSADLFLVFSRSLKKSSDIVDVINDVGSIYMETNGWGGCIDKVIGVGCDIEPSLDTYNPQEFRTNPLWINGPNRQFERTVRALQQSPDGPYDFMYMMGMDSIPIKPNWLDVFVDEIESSTRDFTMMRSKYRGFEFDYNRNRLVTVNRVNENAIYNLSHPLFNRIVEALESEAITSLNSVSYNIRIAQIITEAKDRSRVSSLQSANYSTLLADFENVDNAIVETTLFPDYVGQKLRTDFSYSSGRRIDEWLLPPFRHPLQPTALPMQRRRRLDNILPNIPQSNFQASNFDSSERTGLPTNPIRASSFGKPSASSRTILSTVISVSQSNSLSDSPSSKPSGSFSSLTQSNRLVEITEQTTEPTSLQSACRGPSGSPTISPTESFYPSSVPSYHPTESLGSSTSPSSSGGPTEIPTSSPSESSYPSSIPSDSPAAIVEPSFSPGDPISFLNPSGTPKPTSLQSASRGPSGSPTISPTESFYPSSVPSYHPTKSLGSSTSPSSSGGPTEIPTSSTLSPTNVPSLTLQSTSPSNRLLTETANPTNVPSLTLQSASPSNRPSTETVNPINVPSSTPSFELLSGGLPTNSLIQYPLSSHSDWTIGLIGTIVAIGSVALIALIFYAYKAHFRNTGRPTSIDGSHISLDQQGEFGSNRSDSSLLFMLDGESDASFDTVDLNQGNFVERSDGGFEFVSI